jgi:glycosyltransferase involved in cell wall biosynthesis
VLIMARELNLGGVERDAAKIAMRLDRLRFEPHVSTFYATGLRYEELRAAGIPILHLPLTSLLSMDALRAAAMMRSYIRQHRIRIVHSYDVSGVFGLPVAWFERVPVIIGSQLSYRNLMDKRTQRLLRISDRFADAVLANCKAIGRYLVEEEHLPPGRVEMIYNGVLTDEFYPAVEPRPEPLSRESLTIGTVCVLRPEKNLAVLQEAFAKVRALKPVMKLVFVGSGPELESLEANAVRLGIAADNVFVPATREVARWMRAMNIFVLPSYSEAFSNSLLEAMACGCAVIGSKVGGTPELTGSDEERGLLFESRNAGDLAAKMERLITDERFRLKLGSNAAAFARENLSIEIAVRRTAEMYDRWLLRKTGTNSVSSEDRHPR